TTFDGYQLTRKGRASEALGFAISSSAIGGTYGSIILLLIGPSLAKLALLLNAADIFAVVLLGFVVVVAIDSESILKSLISLFIGMLIATVGMSPLSGVSRFTFELDLLQSGIDFIIVMIGVFALGEVFERISITESKYEHKKKVKANLPSFSMLKSHFKTLARSSVMGNIIGILPGAGAIV